MDTALYLGASLVALPLAPSLDRLARGVRWARPALDGFVVVMVGVLVVFHLVPHAIEQAGGFALLAAVAGFALPWALEALPGRAIRQGSSWVIGVAVVGLMLHVMMDGAAIGTYAHADEKHSSLALAVLIHRVPVSLFVWWTVAPRRGPVVAGLVLLAVGIFTLAGYGLGSAATTLASPAQMALVEAFVGGSLLHVLTGHGLVQKDAPRAPIAETAGALLALVLLVWLPMEVESASAYAGSRDVPQALLHLILESAPALLLGYLLAGLVGTQLPHATVRWAARGSALSQSARGVLFGLPIPICSCGVVPVYRGLVQAGLPATAGMAFLVATPELGLESILLSLPLLGVELTVTRVVAAAAVALIAGLVVGRLVPRAPLAAAQTAPTTASRPWSQRLRDAARFGLSEVVEQTGPWILAGLVIAALLDPAVIGEAVAALPPGAGVFLAALIGMPMYVCASGATPLAAALLFGGLSPGAAVAFLLAGPATNVTTFGVLTRLHGRRIAIGFGATVLLASVGLGLAIDATWPAEWALPGHGHGDESVGLLNWLALLVLAAAGLRLLLLRGPQALLQTLTEAEHDHAHLPGEDHDHDHDHDCGHEGHDHHHHDEAKAPCDDGCHGAK